MPLEMRRMIREMSTANPLWGAPRIHGALLKLGTDISQTSVAKYMARRRAPRHKDGGISFATMLTVLRRRTLSWFRQVRSGFSMGFLL